MFDSASFDARSFDSNSFEFGVVAVTAFFGSIIQSNDITELFTVSSMSKTNQSQLSSADIEQDLQNKRSISSDIESVIKSVKSNQLL